MTKNKRLQLILDTRLDMFQRRILELKRKKRILAIFLFLLCGCSTFPSKIEIELKSSSQPIIQPLKKEIKNEAELILLAFYMEGFNYNWLGGHYSAYKLSHPNYAGSLNGFCIYLRKKEIKSDWWWKIYFRKVKANYIYLKKYGYREPVKNEP